MLVTTHTGVHLENNLDLCGEVLESMFRFIDAHDVGMRTTILDRICKMNIKHETELTEAATQIFSKIQETVDSGVERAATSTNIQLKMLEKKLSTKIENQRLQIVSLTRNEIQTRVGGMIRQYTNVPGLIGDNCKYSTYHRCMLDIHGDLNKGFSELKV